MLPRMNKKEIRVFKNELLKRKGRKLDILEWGSGGSTVYFPKFLKENNIIYSWTSIEYNKVWYEKINRETENDHNISLVLFDVGNTSLKQRNIPMDDYVNYPKTLNKKFDIIFVDGRKRRRCLILAKSLLKDDGVVLLHDARRHYYRCAQKEYKNSVFLAPELWKGSLVPISGMDLFFQKVSNIFYNFLFWFFVFPLRFIKNHVGSKVSGTIYLLSKVVGFRSKIKVLGLVIFFVLKKRGLGFCDFSFSLRLLKNNTLVRFSTKTISSAPQLMDALS